MGQNVLVGHHGAMDFRPVERADDAFQQGVTAEQIDAVMRRVFGAPASVARAIELGAGLYNNTYRVDLVGHERPVVLRVAPAPERQFRSERALMRNEYASVPWLAVIAPLMPKVIAADWSHELIGRDWMVQTFLDGVPAPERLGLYPRSLWPGFFRQMGEIARSVHGVRGPHFGPVAGPVFGSWGEAVIRSLEDIAVDLDSTGLDAADVRKVAAIAVDGRAVLDAVTEPRLITGDLWTVNTMLAADADEPVITGVLDMDRTWWGDPAADWTIRMASAKTDERTAFWDGYGPQQQSPAARWRALVYEARHLGALRLERHRLGNGDGVADSYRALAAVLEALS